MTHFKYILRLGLIGVLGIVVTACAVSPKAVGEKEDTNQVVLNEAPTQTNDQASSSSQEVNFQKGQYYDFLGKTEQGAPIQLSLYWTDESIEGELQYGLNGKNQDLLLSGKWEKGKLLMFTEGEASSPSIKISAKSSEELLVLSGLEKITGDHKEVSLKLNSVVYGDFGKRYAVAGFEDDRKIDEWVLQFKEALAKGDKKAVMDQVAFPIQTEVEGKRVSLSRNEFEKVYDKVMTPALVGQINSSFERMLFSNANGILLGGAEYNVWIGGIEKDGRVEARIIGINH